MKHQLLGGCPPNDALTLTICFGVVLLVRQVFNSAGCYVVAVGKISGMVSRLGSLMKLPIKAVRPATVALHERLQCICSKAGSCP